MSTTAVQLNMFEWYPFNGVISDSFQCLMTSSEVDNEDTVLTELDNGCSSFNDFVISANKVAILKTAHNRLQINKILLINLNY